MILFLVLRYAFYLHINPTLRKFGDLTAEFVKCTEWPATFSNINLLYLNFCQEPEHLHIQRPERVLSVSSVTATNSWKFAIRVRRPERTLSEPGFTQTENVCSAYKSNRRQFHSLDLLQPRTGNVWRLLSHYNTHCTATNGKSGINHQSKKREFYWLRFRGNIT
jgi:hypothetical protein